MCPKKTQKSSEKKNWPIKKVIEAVKKATDADAFFILPTVQGCVCCIQIPEIIQTKPVVSPVRIGLECKVGGFKCPINVREVEFLVGNAGAGRF